MAYIDELLAELKDAFLKERSFDAFSFPQDTISSDDQSIEPICSTFHDNKLINIYRVLDGKNAEKYIYSGHSDDGVVCDYDGPYSSLEDAQKSIGTVLEGWTTY